MTSTGTWPNEYVTIHKSDQEKLIRAVFAAGFRVGHESGRDSATVWDWGVKSSEPQTSDAAWSVYVQPVDIFSPEAWEDVP